MKLKLNSTKKIKKAGLSLTILLIIGILAVINFLSYQIFYRFDLTQGKIYSLSPSSKKIAGNLEDIVNIKAYFSNNLPNQFVSTRREVADVLNEYKAYSNGKISIEFIDPGEDEEMKNELYMKGIPQLTFQVIEKDKAQTLNGYMGVAINYGDKTEIIPVVKQGAGDLEYQLTTAIKKVTAKNDIAVGYVTSNGTMDQSKEIKTGLQALRELYNVKELNLSDNEIPSDIKTLIIAGPKEQFSEHELKSINSFLSRGGSLLVMMDGVNVNQNMQAEVNKTNLDKLLEKYGIKINKNLIADTRNGLASFSQGYMTFSVNYPYWPKITKEGFNNNCNIVSSLEGAILPWASSIEIDGSKIDKNIATALVFTTNQAWESKDNFNISPSIMNANSSNKNEYNLAVELNGMINNAYPDEKNLKFNGRIIIIGDSDFISDNFSINNPDNMNLFLNSVDSLSLGDDLINIRAKNIISRPIKNLSDGARAAIRYVNIFGVTAVVIVFGLTRYYLRRRSKFVDQL